jgi:hypothetical protein
VVFCVHKLSMSDRSGAHGRSVRGVASQEQFYPFDNYVSICLVTSFFLSGNRPRSIPLRRRTMRHGLSP